MKLFKKILSIAVLLSVFSLCFSPMAHAQTALDDIKSHLEGEGISVVDYSSQEGAWGSLPQDWITYLKARDYTSLKDLADKKLKDLFEGEDGLIALRRQLGILEAEKSGLTNQEAIDQKALDIALMKEGIKYQEEAIKDIIAGIVSEASTAGKKEEGKNVIFAEVDFMYSYSKWGRLSQRIIAILESPPLEYQGLQDIVDIYGIENVESAMLDDGLSADDANMIADSVQILYATGEGQINQVARNIANVMKNLVIGLALIWIVYAGTRLVLAQGDESVITEQKRSILYAGIGLMAILLVDRGIDFLYGPAGVARTELVQDQRFTNEILGLVHFMKAFIGSIAILFIIVSGIRMVFASGEESEITKQRTSLLWIGVGLVLVAIDQIIVENIFTIPVSQSDQIKTSNVITLINLLGRVLQFALGFVGLIAFGILIYGAATMIMNFGNDEMVEKSKKIMKNAAIGILVILSAYVIVATLVIFK